MCQARCLRVEDWIIVPLVSEPGAISGAEHVFGIFENSQSPHKSLAKLASEAMMPVQV